MKSHNKTHNKPNFKIDEIALVLIVAVIAIIVSFYDKNAHPDRIEAEKITEIILDNHDISFATGGVVDQNKINEVQGMPYSKLKNFFNAKNDFCIYLEDGDGNVLLAKGSSKLSQDGMACKE